LNSRTRQRRAASGAVLWRKRHKLFGDIVPIYIGMNKLATRSFAMALYKYSNYLTNNTEEAFVSQDTQHRFPEFTSAWDAEGKLSQRKQNHSLPKTITNIL